MQELVHWQSYFKRNATKERRINWDLPCTLTSAERRALIYLLDQFGHAEEFEQYSGQQMKAATSGPAQDITSDNPEAQEIYRECLTYYSDEEQRHAEEFFRLLQKAGGQPTPPKPPDPVTRLVLKLFNTGTSLDNLAALHVTELISCEFYQRLHDHLSDPLAQAVLAAIIRDEHAHLAFHASRLRWASPNLTFRQQRIMWLKNSFSYLLMSGPVYLFLRKGYWPLVGEGWQEWRQMCRTARQQAYQGELRFLQQRVPLGWPGMTRPG